MAKKILAAVFFAMLFAHAAAITINSDKNGFTLGEKIGFSGKCIGKEVALTAAIEDKKILEQKSDCFGGFYAIQAQSLPNHPSGNWKFTVSDSKGTNFLNIFSVAKEETMLLALNVLSPVSEKIKRKEQLNISAQVFFNNKPFSDANVYYWIPNGQAAGMSNAGNGVFNAAIEFPKDFEGKDWSLFIVAFSREKNLRGQTKKGFSVESADIIINVVEPKTGRAQAGISQKFLIEATYADGTPLENASALAVLGTDFELGSIEMQKQSEKEFFLEQAFAEKDIGTKKIVFFAKDSFENSGSKEFEFFVERGFWIDLAQAMFFAPIAAIGIIAIVIVTMSAKKYSKSKKRADSAEFLKKEIKELQEQYFKKSEISESYYRKKLNKLAMELSEAEKKLNTQKTKNR